MVGGNSIVRDEHKSVLMNAVLHQVWTHSENILIPYLNLNDVHKSINTSKSFSKITFHRSHKRSQD
jgi:hypothetical protein